MEPLVSSGGTRDFFWNKPNIKSPVKKRGERIYNRTFFMNIDQIGWRGNRLNDMYLQVSYPCNLKILQDAVAKNVRNEIAIACMLNLMGFKI